MGYRCHRGLNLTNASKFPFQYAMRWDMHAMVIHIVYQKHTLIKHGNGPLIRYVKLGVAHAPGMPGTFSPIPRVSNSDTHHGTCMTHVPWCMPGSLTSCFLWNRWRGKHSRHMRNAQFYESGKRFNKKFWRAYNRSSICSHSPPPHPISQPNPTQHTIILTACLLVTWLKGIGPNEFRLSIIHPGTRML